MAGTVGHFIAFGTDLVGLERILRLFQATCSILIAYPVLLALTQPSQPATHLAATASGLAVLRNQLNVSRRFLRFFRFYDTLNAGWTAYVGPAPKGLDAWLDIISKTCLGTFGMMETVTLLDLLDIDHLRIFGRERNDEINLQIQYFWFAGLYASVLCAGLRLFSLFANRAVPKTGEGYGTGEKPIAATTVDATLTEKTPLSGAVEAEAKEKETVSDSADDASAQDALTKERERLKQVVSHRKSERSAWLHDVSAQVTNIGRGILSDALDMLLPASAVGWVYVSPGAIGLVMFLTTLTTSVPRWQQIGRQLQKSNAA